jgi:hypothetical protein
VLPISIDKRVVYNYKLHIPKSIEKPVIITIIELIIQIMSKIQKLVGSFSFLILDGNGITTPKKITFFL